MQKETDPADPKGLVRESFAIDGITIAECRSIFVDWALSLPDSMPSDRAVKVLLSRYQGAPLDHPMRAVLNEALAAPPPAGRRGGRAGRLS